MRRFFGVSFVLLSLLGPSPALSQETGGGEEQEASGFTLEQNYPNPFSSDTRIPFVLHEELFADGRPPVVSMRVYNLLRQPMAVPEAMNHPAGQGAPLVQLDYPTPGRHEAYWDGRDFAGRSVASGVYWVQLTVNGMSRARKVIVTK